MMNTLKKSVLSVPLILVTAVACSQASYAEPALGRAMALKLTETCVNSVESNKWPPFAIAVFDSYGRMISFQHMDGAMSGASDLAIGKARTSANFPFSTMDVANLVEGNPGAKGLASFPGIVTVQGGLPIILDGKHIGGIGVSGGMPEQDEACAKLSLKSIASNP